MKFAVKRQKIKCILEGGGPDPCLPPQNNRLPICDKHIEELNSTLNNVKVADYIRDNFMIKGDESFLFDRRSGSVYSLNQTGTFIFSLILSGKDFYEILTDLTDTFDVYQTADMLADCNRFVGEIMKLGLLTPGNSA
jgi:hypothetical protein